MMLTTTLKEIQLHKPYASCWKTLLTGLKLTDEITEEQLNEPISFETILKHNGIKDALWALRTQNYKDYCAFLADVAESTLSLFEIHCPDDKRVRACIVTIRLYSKGNATLEDLNDASSNAADAYDYAEAFASSNAADASVYASDAHSPEAAIASALAAALAAAYASASDASAADASAAKEKWVEIKAFFTKFLSQTGN